MQECNELDRLTIEGEKAHREYELKGCSYPEGFEALKRLLQMRLELRLVKN